MVPRECRATGGKRSVEIGIFMDVGAVDGQDIGAKGPLVLQVQCGIKKSITETPDSIGRGADINSVCSGFKVIEPPALLPSQPPIRRDCIDVSSKSCTWI